MQDKDNSFDIIELQNYSNDVQKDIQHSSNQNSNNKSNSAQKNLYQCLSKTSVQEENDNFNPRNAVHFQQFKKEIKQMSYSERIKAFFSNATYNMKTFSKSSWKTVKINSKHRHARLFDQEFNYDENNPEQENNRFLKQHEKIIWFSYRNNFPQIKNVADDNQSASNDYGWGCMIRCSQMLLAEALKRHFLNDQNIQLEMLSQDEEKQFYTNIIKLFLDTTNEANLLNQLESYQTSSSKNLRDELSSNNIYSLFGIQNICQSAILRQYQQSVKNWYTSIQVSVILQEILEQPDSKLNSNLGFHILNFTDQIIFLKELEEASTKDNDRPNNILVMIHLKFGINKFEMQHKDYLIDLLKIKNFVGALSGTETKGMYIIGYQEDRLIVLDPHFIQKATDGEQELEKDYNTYFNKTPRSISLECLSSDISIGYFIEVNEYQSKNQFIDQILTLNEKYQEPLLSILNDRIETDDMEIEDIEFKSEIKNQQNQQSKSNFSQNHDKEQEEEQKQSEPQQYNKMHDFSKNKDIQSISCTSNNENSQINKNSSNKQFINSSDINNKNNSSNHYRIQDFYISNGSALSESSLSNLDKNLNSSEQDQISLSTSGIKKVNQPSNQLDNLRLSNKDYQENNKPIQKNVVYNDFEVIS